MAYNIFERWPFTSFQNLNLDWVLKTVKTAADQAAEAAQTVAGYASRLLDIEVINRQQTANISDLETETEAQHDRIASLEGWSSEASTQLVALDDDVADLQSEMSDTVKTTVQNLDVNEKLQARVNISAGSTSVVYDDEMEAIIITDEITGELETVPVGGGGGGTANAVLYTAQNLNTTQKRQARQNIGTTDVSVNANTRVMTISDRESGAIASYPLGDIETVQYGSAQQLTAAQQLQAQQNIGITSLPNGIFLITAVWDSVSGKYTFDRNQADILTAIQAGKLPVVRFHTTHGASDEHIYNEWVFSYYSYDGEDVFIYFSRINETRAVEVMEYTGSTQGAYLSTRPSLPAATSADNGKIPQVNSFGDYQLVSIPAAENSSFGGV